ncbi:MAG: hypothetical protein A2428_17265 [Bdellovibrionales bacterium RIFOXYC1_FULL_54_43]|nr:MAG: hypothetical protein A2428_17265 [Bdellovibrionales bacterium RIFOXYC1_FULL_54_43]OFZ84472.1 MAG: hypothetical protein A2603_03120 [Bdellovibrionales bacterium RIFOXYD1_FULL_55_31]
MYTSGIAALVIALGLIGCGKARDHQVEKIVTHSESGFRILPEKQAKTEPADFKALSETLTAKARTLDFAGVASKSDRRPAGEPSAPMIPDPEGEFKLCGSVEFAGNAPWVSISPAEWKEVQKAFSSVKRDLTAWLSKSKSRLGESVHDSMKRRVQTTEIRIASRSEQPDIAWRGIGVWGPSSEKIPTIDVGAGFVRLLRDEPRRARFELARLVAQSWSPCALEKEIQAHPWGTFLSCMQIDEGQKCGAGSYSEGGWAVSSAIAAKVAAPGCLLPAFATADSRECHERLLLPQELRANLDAASAGKVNR